MSRNCDEFVTFKEELGEHKVYIGNKTYCDVLGEVNCNFISNGRSIMLLDVLYVPSIRRNLVSVPVLDEKGYKVRFKSGFVIIQKGNVLVKGVKIENMYLLEINNKVSISDYLNVSLDKNDDDALFWE